MEERSLSEVELAKIKGFQKGNTFARNCNGGTQQMCEFRIKTKEKGYTLVELMVVVVIIGILAATAVPVYTSVQAKAEKNACHANLRTIDGMSSQWQMMTQAEQNKISGGFAGMFAGGEVPVCPCSGTYEHNTENDTIRATCTLHGTY